MTPGEKIFVEYFVFPYLRYMPIIGLFFFACSPPASETERALIPFFVIYIYFFFFAGRDVSLQNVKPLFFALILLPVPIIYFKVQIFDFEIFTMSFIIPCIIFMIMPKVFMKVDPQK